jgi:hypothetical protein
MGPATYSQTCARCGDELAGGDRDLVVDAVIAHASEVHAHRLERQVVHAHLAGAHPHDFDEE